MFTIPSLTGISFLSLELLNEKNESLADNFYWLSPREDEYAWDKTEWYYTPMKVSADFRALNYLAPADVNIGYRYQKFDNQLDSRCETDQFLQ